MTSPISIRLDTVQAQYAATDSLHIRFTLTNTSDRTISILKWHTPFDGFNSNVFRVLSPRGRSIPYKGRVVKKGQPRAVDYLELGPHESATQVYDLSRVYDIYQVGDYRIEFLGRILDYGTDVAENLFAKARLLPRAIQSNVLRLSLAENRPRPKSAPRKPKNELVPKAPWQVPPIEMIGLGSSLYVIENQRLWRVDPSTGAYQPRVPATDQNPWKVPPIAMATLGSSLYIIENQRLWKVDPDTGAYQLKVPAGDPNPWRVPPIAMTALGNSLYVIENERLWKVDPNTGAYQLKVPAGDSHPWRVAPIALAAWKDVLFVIENQRLWRVDHSTGGYRTVDNISYVDIPSERRGIVANALASAQEYASEAGHALSSTPDSQRASADRYTNWFGTYDASRYDKVTANYSKIYDALVNKIVTFHSVDEDVYAYVYPDEPYHIYLCSLFWAAPLQGTDSQAGTIIHETSHFTVVAGTDDHTYGHSSCQTLATNNPSDAIDNADSTEYFAENDPPLSMD